MILRPFGSVFRFHRTQASEPHRREKTLLLVIDEAQVLARDAHADFAHALRAALDVGHALRRLQEANIITRLTLGDYQFEDEAFGEFVRRQPSGLSGL